MLFNILLKILDLYNIEKSSRKPCIKPNPQDSISKTRKQEEVDGQQGLESSSIIKNWKWGLNLNPSKKILSFSSDRRSRRSRQSLWRSFWSSERINWINIFILFGNSIQHLGGSVPHHTNKLWWCNLHNKSCNARICHLFLWN